MKITKSILKQIIKEELEAVMESEKDVEMGPDNYKSFIDFKIEEALMNLRHELERQIGKIFGSGSESDDHENAMDHLEKIGKLISAIPDDKKTRKNELANS